MRFRIANVDMVDTVMAILRLLIKTMLKGDPNHLGIFPTYLKANRSISQIIVTMYDQVPGGMGILDHLCSLTVMTLKMSLEVLINYSQL